MMKKSTSLMIIGGFATTWILWTSTSGGGLLTFPSRPFAQEMVAPNLFSTFQLREQWEIDGSTSVFFVETNLQMSILPPRIICALESVARHNPDRQIYHIAEGDVGSQQYGDVLNHYPNIKFLTRNFRDLIENSPLETIFKRKLNGTKFLVENISNMIRLLIPFLFGGVYLDTDVILLKHLPDISNFLVHVQRDYLSNAVSGFEPQHPFIYEALVNMAKDFQPETWGYNGPDLVTRVAKEFCPKYGGTRKEEIFIGGVRSWKCGNIQMLNHSAAYPIHYSNFKQLLDSKCTLQVQDAISHSFGVHYWNKMIYWNNETILRENQPLYKIFRQNCPRTESAHLRPLLNQPFHVRG